MSSMSSSAPMAKSVCADDATYDVMTGGGDGIAAEDEARECARGADDQ
jgi:hypothetical protein